MRLPDLDAEVTHWTKNYPSGKVVMVWTFTVYGDEYHSSEDFTTKEEAQTALLNFLAKKYHFEYSEKEEETWE